MGAEHRLQHPTSGEYVHLSYPSALVIVAVIKHQKNLGEEMVYFTVNSGGRN